MGADVAAPRQSAAIFVRAQSAALCRDAATSKPGEMAPSFETALLEVIDLDSHGIGELVVTTLTNYFMPLVRYRIGDLVERRTQPYQTRYVVDGRVADAVRRADGTRSDRVAGGPVFCGPDGVAHYQLRQARTAGGACGLCRMAWPEPGHSRNCRPGWKACWMRRGD